MKHINLIAIWATLLFAFFSCENKYKSPIPDVPVEISLNMLSYNPTFGSVINDTMTFTYPRQYPPFAIGYGGVLVVVGYDENLDTRYFSYDLCCPYEADPDVRVITGLSYHYPDKYKVGYAVCPKCGSEFYITDGWGRVSKGPSKFPLKRYQTEYVNNYLIVRN
ncbi:MAG: hypothetical protein ACK5KP_06875 [Paludibacteraceae bacterium]